jgi:KaiC/GvpD/RAD55 family RecA-like ATPase
MKNKPENLREAGMMAVTGIQGVGKTYLNMHIIAEYVKNKGTVNGRKCLIMDTNGEYTEEQFKGNKVSSVIPKIISLKDIPAWSRTDAAEVRRIDAKSLGIKQKKVVLEYILKVYRNGMLVIEDINTYFLSITHMEEIVGGIVNLRHRAVDVLISYQSARAVEPRIWQNSRWVRMHYQADNIKEIRNKIPNYAMYKIAQNIVNNKYYDGDKRFYVYIHNFTNKIEGNFSIDEFKYGCEQFLSINRKSIKEHAEMMDIKNLEQAKKALIEQYVEDYFGNKK